MVEPGFFLDVNDSTEGSGNISNDSWECPTTLDSISSGLLHYHATVLALIVFISLAGNGLVLLLFARFRALRTRSMVVSMGMVVADLLFTLAYTLQVIVTTASKKWVFGDFGCDAFGFMASELLITRWLIVSLLCLDRFLTVKYPFSYEKRSNGLLITFMTVAWVVPAVVSVIPPLGNFVMYELRVTQPACLPSCEPESIICRAYYFLVFTTIYILGSIVPIILYLWLYYKARKLRKSTNYALGRLTIQIASGILVSQPVSERNNAVIKDKRATITIVLIIAAVVITGTPGYSFQILRSISPMLRCRVPSIVNFIMIEFFLSAPMLTPLVIMRDRLFRSCLMELFCCRKKTADMQLDTDSNRSPEKSFTGIYRRSSVSNDTPQSPKEASGNGGSSSNGQTELRIATVNPSVSESCESPQHQSLHLEH